MENGSKLCHATSRNPDNDPLGNEYHQILLQIPNAISNIQKLSVVYLVCPLAFVPIYAASSDCSKGRGERDAPISYHCINAVEVGAKRPQLDLP